ncbi:precorrin-2 dehydrogenase/sirohydrochlorin ferrochelatase family protein [Corynebacterium dentalis]|uniref:precorrin-2 dehydrogenase/sirohydrochlorin ferrochelatase family protein n=1 Tax=Corynebacterium dentalis TaxID=2014528 RepID=UPI00289C6248|nr:NAD(P)-dependent oxidoreductase [Corynebacterium dentalis]
MKQQHIPSPAHTTTNTMVGLDFCGALVVLVGGGPVTARRVRKLVTKKAIVRVVAPELCPEMHRLRGNVEWIPEEFAPHHLDNAWFVTTCTGDAGVDAWVARECHQRRIWCVNSGAVGQGNARYCAEVEVEDSTVGVIAVGAMSTHGAHPKRSVHLARRISHFIQAALHRGEFHSAFPARNAA